MATDPPTAPEPVAPEPSADPEPDVDDRARARLEALTQAGDHEQALALAEQEFARISSQQVPDAKLLREIQMSASKGGALSLHLQVLRRRTEIAPDDRSLRRFLRAAEGRWKESEPGWLPTIDPDVLAGLDRPAPPGGSRRVLHLLKIGMPQRQSGYSMRSMYTLTGQARAGLDPVAVTALDFPRTLGIEDVPQEDVVGGVRYRHLLRETIPPKEPWDAYLDAYASALAPVVAEEAPDLIHVHSGHRGTEAALVALAVGRALDIPVVYEVRGFFEALWTRDVAWAERAEIYRRRWAAEAGAMRSAAAVVTLSESMKADIVSREVDPGHVHVVPNGVDPSAFVPVERDEGLSAELGLTDRFVFGYVSNLDHYREGQELLIDAAVELRRRGVPATALIVGDGGRRELLEQHARDIDAGDAVHFTGRIPHDDVVQYYAQLDVFVIPRIDERAARLVTPLKPYEAMALGVPLVVSDLPALQEITGAGARGETFVTGDASSLADVLQTLADSPERRARLAADARAWVLEHRTWAHNDPRYARIYDEVLDSTRPAGSS
ncbi:MAG: glycosyltransferase family 4 protein [Janibacter sp.]